MTYLNAKSAQYRHNRSIKTPHTTVYIKNYTASVSIVWIFRSILLICLVSPGVLSAAAKDSTSATPATKNALEYFFHQSFNNLSEELDIAKEQNKKGIFVMFNDPDCPWCAKMKATVMNQVKVQDYYRKYFRIIHIDTKGNTVLTDFTGKEMTEKDYAFKVNRVRATPVMMFFDLQGKKMLRYTGATRNIEEFLWLGDFVISDTYKTMKFSKYKRQRRAAQR